MFDEYEPVIRNSLYDDKALPAHDKRAYLALVSLIHNHRQHDMVHLARRKHLPFDEFTRFDNAWTCRRGLEGPRLSNSGVRRGTLAVRKTPVKL